MQLSSFLSQVPRVFETARDDKVIMSNYRKTMQSLHDYVDTAESVVESSIIERSTSVSMRISTLEGSQGM
jgi:hypothetical protein